MGWKHHILEKDKGFTLMETMVTVAIIAILIAVSVPGIAVFMPNYRLKVAVQDIFSNMQSAKMEAIKTNSDYIITFNEAGDSYTLNGARTVDLGDYKSGVRYGHPSGSPVITYDDNNPVNSVVFNRRGMVTQDDSQEWVYLKNNKDNYFRVGTSTTGVIRIQRWNGSAFE